MKPWILLLLALVGASAQEPLHFEHINGENSGLSHNTMTSVFQDHQGYMWFGSVDGLNRFDGYTNKVFRHDPKDPHSLPSNFIHGILEDGERNLWVGTRDGGLAVLAAARTDFIFRRFRHDPNDPTSLSDDRVQAFYLDSGKRLWVGTGQGLDLYQPGQDSFVHYKLFPDQQTVVTSLTEDHGGSLWIATFDGLFRLDLQALSEIDPSLSFKHVEVLRTDPGSKEGLPTNLISSLYTDRDGMIWIGMRGYGFSRLDPVTRQFKHYRHDPGNPNGPASDNDAVSFQDSQGRLWLAGQGLGIFDPLTEQFTYHQHQPSRLKSLSNDNVTHIYQSRDGKEGSIWVLTWGGGVNRLITQDTLFGLERHDPLNDNSMSVNFVFSLLEDRFGDLWVGTIGGGLNRWQWDTGVWSRFVHDPSDESSISDNNIWHITEASNGDLWVGTERGGLEQIPRPERDAPVRFVHHGDLGISNNIKAVLEDRAGDFWIGSNGQGLMRETGDGWAVFRHDPTRQDSLSGDAITCILEDRDGQLWIGTNHSGLNRWLGDGRFAHYRFREDEPESLGSDDIRDLLESSDGQIWVAVYGGGINRLDPESVRVRRFTERDGLSNDFAYALLEDEQGLIWASTNRGLNAFNPETATFTHYRMEHGLQSDEFNTGASFKGRDGALYFGGVNGLNYVYPRELQKALEAQRSVDVPVVLTDFVKMGEAQFPRSPMVLDHDDQFFNFQLAVLDYHQPEKNRFQYKLEPFDKDWIVNGNRNYGGYTNLDPGTYRLRFKGANRSDSWREGTPLDILIRPPFWQTWWFRSLMLLAVVLFGFGFVRVREFYRVWRGAHYLGHFKLLDSLGKGGSGTVYKAQNRLTKEIVALKVLNPELETAKEGVRRFLQEAEIGIKLEHPNIVRIYETGSQGTRRYISMAYLEGDTLQAFMQANQVTQAQRLDLAKQILAGLAEIHKHEIVHRDLKSANVMVLPDGRAVIMDFGLARISALTTMNNQDQLMGTLAYMSPEQTIGKQVDGRSDIYALGVIFYEMWLGRLPFQADNQMELIYAIHNEMPPGLNSSPMHQIIAKCLEKEVEQRFPNVEELSKALSDLGND